LTYFLDFDHGPASGTGVDYPEFFNTLTGDLNSASLPGPALLLANGLGQIVVILRVALLQLLYHQFIGAPQSGSTFSIVLERSL